LRWKREADAEKLTEMLWLLAASSPFTGASASVTSTPNGFVPGSNLPGHDEYGWIIDILNWMYVHVPYFVILAPVLLAVCLILLVLGYTKKFYADADLRKRAEDAEKAQRLAEDALELANTDNERLRLILQVVVTNLTRRDRIDYGAPQGEPVPIAPDGLRNLCEWIPQILKLEKADLNKITVWRPTEDGTQLEIVEFNGLNPENARSLRLPVKPDKSDRDTFAAMAFRNERVEFCPDTKSDPRYVNVSEGAPTHQYRSIIAVPIRRGSRVVGAYTIDSREPNRFPQDDQAALQQYELYGQLFALFVTIAPENGIEIGGGVADAKDLPVIPPPNMTRDSSGGDGQK
jgi:GAF domain